MVNKLFLASAAMDAVGQIAQNIDGSASTSASHGTAQLRAQQEAAGNDIERLFMITEALWMLLKELHGLTDDDLEHIIQEIDLRSGKLDGKRARQERPVCPACTRRNSGRLPSCMYCGTTLPITPFAKY